MIFSPTGRCSFAPNAGRYPPGSSSWRLSGFLASMSYATRLAWFSFVLAWLAKSVVLRYGGVGTYQRLKPAALGLIAGEAAIGGAFLVASLVLRLCGIDLGPCPRFLP